MSDSLSSIQEKIDFIDEDLARNHRAQVHLDDNRVLRREMEELLIDLKETLRKEEADVNKLQNMSVNSVFRLFLKNTDTQLEIEQQEYVVAALKYNECLEVIDLLDFEAEVLERNLKNESGLNAQRLLLITKKEEALKTSSPEVAARLSVIDYKKTRRQLAIDEVNEAIREGMKAEVKILEIIKNLNKVDNWGNWGAAMNYQSDYARRSYIDRTRKTAVETKLVLSKFETELKDVFRNLNVRDDLTLDAFDQFLAVFYDNLITDWIVQNQLRHTRNSIEGVLAKTRRLLASLNREKNQLAEELQTLNEERTTLILERT